MNLFEYKQRCLHELAEGSLHYVGDSLVGVPNAALMISAQEAELLEKLWETAYYAWQTNQTQHKKWDETLRHSQSQVKRLTRARVDRRFKR